MAFGRKSLRGRRYYDLREKHFTPREASEFSKLSRKYPALQHLIIFRRALWMNFVQEARRKGWESEKRRSHEWRQKVANFYERQRVKRTKDRDTGRARERVVNWVVGKDVHGQEFKTPRISPWEWYDWVFQRLPDELKWDTPRSHRIRQADVKVDKLQTRRWIEDLRKSIERTVDEREREKFRQQIRNLERSLRKP